MAPRTNSTFPEVGKVCTDARLAGAVGDRRGITRVAAWRRAGAQITATSLPDLIKTNIH